MSQWTIDELDRRARVEAGESVLVDMHSGCDSALRSWAKQSGLMSRIDRGTPWGNPFKVPDHGSDSEVIEKYREHLHANPALLERIGDLHGKVLGCWCYPRPCHGEVLLAELRRLSSTG